MLVAKNPDGKFSLYITRQNVIHNLDGETGKVNWTATATFAPASDQFVHHGIFYSEPFVALQLQNT